MICHYWYFKAIAYKYDLSMMVYDLNDFMILNLKCVDYRCLVLKMSRNDATKLLINSVLDNK